MSGSTKPIRHRAAGCLGDFLLWWVILPCAIAFLVGAYYFSSVLLLGAIIVIVMAVFVVLLTTTVGYLRAKQAAIEREMRDGNGPPTSNP